MIVKIVVIVGMSRLSILLKIMRSPSMMALIQVEYKNLQFLMNILEIVQDNNNNDDADDV